MAMNKKEKQIVEDLKIRCALHFTEKVEKDVPIPEDYDTIVNGYNQNPHSMRVEKSCSDRTHHNNWGWDKTESQKPIEQYSNRLLAFKAMRNEVELQCAEKLRKIDIMIENEVDKEREISIFFHSIGE